MLKLLSYGLMSIAAVYLCSELSSSKDAFTPVSLNPDPLVEICMTCTFFKRLHASLAITLNMWGCFEVGRESLAVSSLIAYPKTFVTHTLYLPTAVRLRLGISASNRPCENLVVNVFTAMSGSCTAISKTRPRACLNPRPSVSLATMEITTAEPRETSAGMLPESRPWMRICDCMSDGVDSTLPRMLISVGMA